MSNVRGCVSWGRYSGLSQSQETLDKMKTITFLQEEFEGHVVEHFSYEESETLRNFDTVPDAYWPGIEHNPEF